MAQRIAITVMVVALMAAIGMKTDPADFREIWARRRAFLGAFVVNLVAVPLVTLLALAWVPLPEEATVGLMICAVSPGGATGPLFASMARGHLAIAVSAMIGLSLVSVLSAPLSLAQALGASGAMDLSPLIVPMVGTLAFTQMLPLVLGMTLRRFAPALAKRLARPTSLLANAILLLVIAGLLVTRGGALLELGLSGIGLCIGLVLINLLLGALLSRDPGARRSFSLVTGVRNIALALLISSAYFPAPLTEAAVLTFGLFMMLLPLGLALALRRT